MLRKRKIFLVFLIVVTFLVASVFVWVARNRINGTKQQISEAVEDRALVQIGDVYQSVALPSGAISQPTAAERNDFSGFAGLPSMADKEFYQNDTLIYSEDKNKVALASLIGSQENRDKKKEFFCDLAQKKCTSQKIFFNDFKIGETDILSSAVWWLTWNSQSNTVIGMTTNADNSGTLYACSVEQKTCTKNSEDKLNFPTGTINPASDRAVAIRQSDIPNEKTGASWELLVYATQDLAAPTKSYDISAAIDRDEDLVYDGVNSVAWSKDEQTILIGTTRNIFKLELESSKLEKIYADVSVGEGDLYWNSNELQFSPSGRYAIFIDTVSVNLAGGEDEASDEVIDDEAVIETDEAGIGGEVGAENVDLVESGDYDEGILKIVDLQENSSVTELLQAKDLILK